MSRKSLRGVAGSVGVLLCLPVFGLIAEVRPALAQPQTAEQTALRDQVERRFNVLEVREGLLLTPKSPRSGVGAVEVADDAVSVDGQPVTGGELRDRLDGDADVVLQLSYLDAATRRTLFSRAALPPTPPAPPEGDRDRARNRVEQRIRDRIENRAARHGDRVRFGSDVVVGKDEVVDGDVVSMGGSVRVDGEVNGDVVAMGGNVELGPSAHVSKGIVVLGGTLRQDPSARIDGEVQEFGNGGVNVGRWKLPVLGALWARSLFGSALSLLATLARIAFLCLLSAIVILLGRDYVERVGVEAAAEPVKSGAIGVLSQILFLPVFVITIVVLVLTIVGIPLLLLIPFLLLGLVLVALVGFTAVAFRLGTLINSRFGWTRGPYATTIAGILLVVSPLVLARLVSFGGFIASPIRVMLVVLGTLVEYMAWTVGFGAVALARFSHRQVVTA